MCGSALEAEQVYNKVAVENLALLATVAQLDLRRQTSVYQCAFPQCERKMLSFARREHLVRHLYVHTGEKPFKCPTCGRGFNRADNMRQHRKIHMDAKEKAEKEASSCPSKATLAKIRPKTIIKPVPSNNVKMEQNSLETEPKLMPISGFR
eukprot:Lithocolla_globosa_v1_NODE_7620_length_923_cov_12.251152.p1 type:complete len:151 gc:universal NODE_7620_length_923_cov_12.251152:93-545(+)